MKKLTLILSLMTSLVVSEANAANATFTGTITRLLPSSGNINFRLDIETGCSPIHTGHYFKVEADDVDKKDYYAMLLWAAHTQTPVIVSGDDASCSDNQIKSTSVRYVYQDF